MTPLVPDDDAAWQPWRSQWRLREDTTYLNHGSFGPPPEPVRAARRRWLDRLDCQPMDFFVRTLEPALTHARSRLAQFVGTSSANLVFAENATAAMNVIADCFRLQPGDEIVLTDHEYGAVKRIWQRACRRAGTLDPRIATLSLPVGSAEQVVNDVFSAVTERTRLIVISHITSPTAIILPVQQICEKAHERNVAVCVDGPHALVQTSLAIDSLGCDFYTASCHKWLCAPFGSGLLYVHPRHQEWIEPQVLSWGAIPPSVPEHWTDEFIWNGTRDPSAYLTVPAAIDFFACLGWPAVRARMHALAHYSRKCLLDQIGLEPIVPDCEQWYGSMAVAALPAGEARWLQQALWDRYRIEVPIINFGDRRFVRVSCHIYNQKQQIDQLVNALRELLNRE